MPAVPESSITRLGIIAGGGSLPGQLLHACDKKGIETFVVAFDEHTDPAILKDRRYLLTRLGAAGLIINTLKSQNIRDLVFIGTIRRPSLKEMRPDMRTLKFFARLATRALGDDGLLKAMKKELEREGFRLHGVQEFADGLIASAGPMSMCQPKDADHDDIKRGLEIIRTLGPLDIGQGVVMQEGIVLGVEAAEGTDALIHRCGQLKRAGRGPILIKMSKPGQDKDLDLPTVGPNTIINAAESGFSGIVIEAGRTLVSEPDRMAELANKSGLFVIGIEQGL